MKKEILLTLLTFVFLSIGAYFCYKKKLEINEVKAPVNSFLFINYDNNYINSNIDFLDKKTILKTAIIKNMQIDDLNTIINKFNISYYYNY